MFADSRHSNTAAPDSSATTRTSGHPERRSRQYPAAPVVASALSVDTALKQDKRGWG
jgi:hypothetical protein